MATYKKKVVGVEDMVLLSKLKESEVSENLRKRHQADEIYTYIGNVLISVNPYKKLPIYDNSFVEKYKGKFRHELPPHIYAIAEAAYRNMLNHRENQCVIISGESGAGKTEASKLIMHYIAAVSGKSEGVEKIKNIILESNPLLEAFGNAKTVRNNNSSRFGKYFEIQFNSNGDPDGGRITNYLLEKSRVVYQQAGERNFHIFYQLCAGVTGDMKEEFATTDPKHFHYLNQSGCFTVDNIDDKADFEATRHAMDVIGITKEEQYQIFRLVAGILWLGNITFVKQGNQTVVEDENTLKYAAYLLDVDPGVLQKALLTRVIQTGGHRGSTIHVPQTPEQACILRDALAKALYDRQFDWIVAKINAAMKKSGSEDKVVISVLDIYGFEIFDNNGFEQFCINYVNEKLQQIFIELTLKQEQEEYKNEGIKWVPIDYFNNKIVCDLCEGRKPPGVFPLLDDTCHTTHSMTAEQADEKFVQKLSEQASGHKHLIIRGKDLFIIKHYAGDVAYFTAGFTEKNKDILYDTLIECMKTSQSSYIRNFFPEDTSSRTKKKPTTSGFKIVQSANGLIVALKKCNPHYIRCIKPNEVKKPKEFDQKRVLHQVQYLGLLENIRVRRAGWAYRAEFDKFVELFKILSKKTWPRFHGDPKEGCKVLMDDLKIPPEEWQLGKTKIFLRHPETLFGLEEMKERKFHESATKIARTWRAYKMKSYFATLRDSAADLLQGKKQRRRLSLNKFFSGDYIKYSSNAQIQQVMKPYASEGVVFADLFTRPIRNKFMGHRFTNTYVLVTPKHLYLIERVKVKKQFLMQLIARINWNQLEKISLSTRPDSYVIIHVRNAESYFMEGYNKTEFLAILNDHYKKEKGHNVTIEIADQAQYSANAKGKKKKVIWKGDPSGKAKIATLSSSSSTWTVTICDDLPADSKPKPSPQKVYRQQVSKPKQTYQPSYQPTYQQPAQQQIRRATRSHSMRFVMDTNVDTQPVQQAPKPVMQQQKTGFQIPTGGRGMLKPVSNSGPQKQFGTATPKFGQQKTGFSKGPTNTGFRPNPVKTNTGQQKFGGPVNKAPVGAKKPPPPPRKKDNRVKVRALYDYVAQGDDEITIREGDIIYLIEKDPTGWWEGELPNGKKGLFPGNYVEELK